MVARTIMRERCEKYIVEIEVGVDSRNWRSRKISGDGEKVVSTIDTLGYLTYLYTTFKGECSLAQHSWSHF